MPVRRAFVTHLLVDLLLVGLVIFFALRNAAGSRVLQYGIVHGVPTREKVVALTFDDGPHPKYTPEILKILDRYHVKATFFMIGSRMNEYPGIVKEVVARGHAIGNHTYTHPHDIEADTEGQIKEELENCERVIERFTGKRTHIFRPPRGLLDGTVFSIASEEKYWTVLWTVSADHHEATTPELMAQRVLKYVKPGGIILLHDGMYSSRWKDVEATHLIIEALRKKGYRFVTVPELLEIAQKSG